MQGRETLDYEIARMFYSSGLPFHFARNPHYKKAFAFACNNFISGYKLPGYNKLRTTLLENERRHVDKLLEPIRNSWSQKGVTIVSDGWSDPQRRPLINFMAVTESGPMAAGLIIESEFPSIYWTPCVVHTLNLALKNICAAKNTERNSTVYEECSWITKIAEDVMLIMNFIMCHSMRLLIFHSFNSLQLISIAPTRFASTIVMLKRFRELKKGLQEMVISDKWNSYKDDDVEKAKLVREKLLDVSWWDKVDYILSFTSPIYDVLRKMDTDASTLHVVYEMWDSMIENVRKVIYKYERKTESEVSTFYEVVHSILVDQWTKSSKPLHCLAHSLNPRYYSHEWLSEDASRVRPHQDVEITRERMKCFRKYFVDVDVRRRVNVEFASFSDGREGFDDIDSLGDRGRIDAKSWWLTHGAHAPLLQQVALKLLGQPCSSSCSERNWSTYSFIHSLKRNKMTPERNWSTYSFIHSLKRNKMTPERAKDLVFIHSNLRLISRSSPQYHEGETKTWDIAGDAFEFLDEGGCGILEVANLSLDEPELEAIFFNDDGGQEGGASH
ncbi:uncharacterized protein LOC130725055 [Lotus japonicus]|uniref:uncharacterized protein LOC130725055 n=1 Tax=Lotus japonicus TaxID=34305 RepID=UPI002588C189|nr:uncharacterized protein LOC130725055 [Lotus japonicus]